MRRANSIVLALAFVAASLGLSGTAHAAPMCFGKRATIVGTNEFGTKDRLIGTPGDDVIVGRRGIDVIEGRGGNDRICGGEGTDRLRGGAGNDRINTGNQYCEERYYEVLEGNEGHDLVIGSQCSDKLYGGRGRDRVIGNGSVLSSDLIFGGQGDDELVYAPRDPECECNEGAVFTPGPGDDRIDTSNHDAQLSYVPSVRGVQIDLPAGRVTGEGTDSFNGDIFAVQGSDHIDVFTGDDDGSGFVGNGGADRITGGAGADALFGGAGADLIEAAAGNDHVEGDLGSDELSGGDGIDTVSYTGYRRPVHVDLMLGEATGEGEDTLSGFENIYGGRANDVLLGDDGPNEIHDCCRAKSADTMDGRGGDDVITSDFGPDTLSGGSGNDDIFGDNGDDTIDGGDGIDDIDGGEGDDTCTNGEVVTNCERQ